MGSLEVFVANATKVPNVETFGKSDPYVSIEFQGEFKANYCRKSGVKLDVKLPCFGGYRAC